MSLEDEIEALDEAEERSPRSARSGRTAGSGAQQRLDMEGESEEEEEDEVEDEEAQDDEEEQVASGEQQRASMGSGELMGSGPYNAREVNDQVFEELLLNESVIEEMQLAWNAFLQSSESKEAAGEAIYAALFDAFPGLQSLFKTPRAVAAMRYLVGINNIVTGLGSPKALKTTVETLGFQHLDIEVTTPRVVIFRDAIVDLMHVELGTRFTQKAMDGMRTMFNYVGGAFIFVRVKYAERLKVLATSWAQANNKDLEEVRAARGEDEEGEGEGESGQQPEVLGDSPESRDKSADAKAKKGERSKDGSGNKNWFGGSTQAKPGQKGPAAEVEGTQQQLLNNAVPRNFKDMFMFNAAVMGYAGSAWMQEVLGSFDAIVTNVSNSYRLQEECDVLSLRMAKYRGTINLAEFKAVMLASLRSLVKEWGSLHETSWSWLWENVERMLKLLLGKPVSQEQALAVMLGSFDDQFLNQIRTEIYKKFFTMAPTGQDHFKQSTTRLHFIADRVIALTLEMYREPKRMVDYISALGLRHVGYGIPTDMFPPFVTCCVEVMRLLSKDEKASDAFSWSLNLISRMLQRVISEGSTIVMQAINANSSKLLRKGVACAPRGKRALWVLNVQVGTQSISPLMWAIETGSFDAAKAIIIDLLTIRADRDRYYYGMDILFERHPDIIKRLCADAPAMLPVLLDGLIWRSRATANGMRRVNYYFKHLIVDAQGDFSQATEWIVDFNDPNIACHPVVSLVTDSVWNSIALRTFLFRKTWFLLTLIVYLFSQSILHHLDVGRIDDWSADHPEGGFVPTETEYFQHSLHVRLLIVLTRGFIYIGIIGRWLYYHAKWTTYAIKKQDFIKIAGRVKVPAYWSHWQDAASLCLTLCLIIMVFLDPTWRCFEWTIELFDEHCLDAFSWIPLYKTTSTFATLLYFLLLTDLAVLSTRVSAFVLVFGRVISEVFLFLFGLTFFVLAFASAISSLEHDDPEFSGIPTSTVNLFRISFSMFSGADFDDMTHYPSLFVAVFIFTIIAVIFLLNLLIAQLNCAYQATYQDMLGFARLNRGKIMTETMLSVARARWEVYVDSLRLEERIEFGEGDIGLAGGIQVLEPASANITTSDTIRRFGGTTSPAAQWPQDDAGGDDESDRFERLERFIEKSIKRLVSNGRRGGSGAGNSSVGMSSMAMGSSTLNTGDSSGNQESASD